MITEWSSSVVNFLKQNKIFLSYSLTLMAVYLFGFICGVFAFDFIPQIESLAGANPFHLLVTGHQWGPRLLVAYPAVVIHNIFSLSLDTGFTIYCVTLLFGIVLFLYHIGEKLEVRYSHAKFIFYLTGIIVTILLSIVMNGRLIPAYFGLMIILYLQYHVFEQKRNFTIKEYLLMFVGFMFTTTSSGTMMVGLFQTIIAGLSFIFFSKDKKRSYITFCVVHVILYGMIIGPHIIQMINKNLSFYGGGLMGLKNMLDHGTGKIFLIAPPFLIFLIILLISVLLVFVYKRYGNLLKLGAVQPFTMAVPITLICGLFGFSTAAMIIVPLIYFSALTLTKIVNKEKLFLRSE